METDAQGRRTWLRRGPDGQVESEFGGVSGLRQPVAFGAETISVDDVAREARAVDPMDCDTLPEGGTGARVR